MSCTSHFGSFLVCLFTSSQHEEISRLSIWCFVWGINIKRIKLRRVLAILYKYPPHPPPTRIEQGTSRTDKERGRERFNTGFYIQVLPS